MSVNRWYEGCHPDLLLLWSYRCEAEGRGKISMKKAVFKRGFVQEKWVINIIDEKILQKKKKTLTGSRRHLVEKLLNTQVREASYGFIIWYWVSCPLHRLKTKNTVTIVIDKMSSLNCIPTLQVLLFWRD